MASNPTKTTIKICSVDGCGKPTRARGFCTACYYRKIRHGDIETKTSTKNWKHRLSQINEEQRTAVCTTCGPTKIYSRGAGKWRCKTDVNERSKLYKQAYRESKKVMLLDHCEICGSQQKLCWDHCHNTGEFRGTLCSQCNAAIGLLKDDPSVLLKAVAYLERFNVNDESAIPTEIV